MSEKIKRSFIVVGENGNEIAATEHGPMVLLEIGDEVVLLSQDTWYELCGLKYEIRFSQPAPKPEIIEKEY